MNVAAAVLERNGLLRELHERDRERWEARRAATLASRIHVACAAIALLRKTDEIVARLLVGIHDVLRFERVAYYLHGTGECSGPLRLHTALTVGMRAAPEIIVDCGRIDVAVGVANELASPAVDVMRWYVAAPVNASEHTLGLVYADGHASPAPNDRIVEFLLTLNTVSAAALRTASALALAHQLATCDPLTGLLNRRALYERIERELADCRDRGTQCACALIDLDGLKAINDFCGHSIGDAVLVHVARTLASKLREHDFAARLGGDEFVFVLHDVDAASARELMRSLCAALYAEGLRCSVGIALGGAKRQSAGSLLAAADRALYAVKAAGRNGYAFA